MAERDLYRNNEWRWIQGSPVTLTGYRIVYNDFGEYLTYASIKNTGANVLFSVYADIILEANDGTQLTRVNSLQLGRGSVNPGESVSFSVKMLSVEQKPDDIGTARVIVTKVQFTNGSIWRNISGSEGVALAPQRSCEGLGESAIEFLEAVFGEGNIKYIPDEIDGGWRCTCGTPNVKKLDKCSFCGASHRNIVQYFSEERLRYSAAEYERAKIEAAKEELIEEKYQAAQNVDYSVEAYEKAAGVLDSLGNYKDSAVTAERYRRIAEQIRRDIEEKEKSRIYFEAMNFEPNSENYFYHAEKLRSLGNYRDSEEKAAEYQRTAERLKISEEKFDAELEARRRIQALKKRKRLLVLGSLAGVILTVLIAATVSVVCYFIPMSKYSDAVKLMELDSAEELLQAEALFKELGGFSDSKEMAEKCRHLYYVKLTGKENYVSVTTSRHTWLKITSDGVLTCDKDKMEPTGKYVIPDIVDGILVTELGMKAFFMCEDITEIVLPSSVKVIGERAFGGCASLGGVLIPDSVEIIEPYAFQNCTSLSYAKLGSGLKEIGERAFIGCEFLDEIVLRDSVEIVKYKAFSGCVSLERVVFGSGIKKLGIAVFAECGQIESIEYNGTKAEWALVEIGEQNENIINSNIKYSDD